MLAQYIAVGFNNPSQFPNQPFLQKLDRPSLQRMTDEEMAAAAKRNAAQWKEINHGREKLNN